MSKDPLDFGAEIEVAIGIYRDSESRDVYHVRVVSFNGGTSEEYQLLDSDNVREICKVEIDALVEKESR